MIKFKDYIKLRESGDDFGGENPFEGGDQLEALRIAWKRYRTQTIDFLHGLDDPEIEDAIKKNDDEGLNKSGNKGGKDDVVIAPKADGNPGMEEGGWD